MAEALTRPSPYVLSLVLARPYSLLGAIFLICLVVPFLRRDQDWMTVYIPAAERLAIGEDIYRGGFVYPPVNACLAVPFVGLPRLSAQLLQYAVNMAALAILVLGAWKLSGGGRLEGVAAIPRREHLIFWLGMGCGISSCLDAITNQQTDLIVAALVILGCFALRNSHHLRAGIWFGVAAGIKCTPLLWAGYLAWRKRWLAAGMVVAVAGVVNLLPDFAYPPTTGTPRLGDWVQRYLVPMGERKHDFGSWACGIGGNQSVGGVWHRILVFRASWNGEDLDVTPITGRASPELLKAVAWSTLLLLVGVGLISSWKARYCPSATAPSPQALEFGMVLLLMVLMSPHSSKPHFCTLLLPGFCVARAALNGLNRRLLGVLLAAVACVLLSNKDLVGEQVYAWGKWYGSLPLGAVILHLASCCVLLARRPRPATPIEKEPLPDLVSENRVVIGREQPINADETPVRSAAVSS